MALEEFLLDLCEESVSAALLVCVVLSSPSGSCVRTTPLKAMGDPIIDILALPNLPTRPRLRTASASLPDLSEGVQ